MEKKIIKIIADIAEVPEESINLNTNLVTDLELESLDFVTLIATFEEEYRMEIPDKDLKKIQTVNDIVEYFNKNV